MRTVVLPIESSRSSGRALLRGIAKYSRLHGPWTFYWEPGGLDEVLPRLKNLNTDGIIMRDSELVQEVIELGIPLIVVGHHFKKVEGVTNIISDSKAIGRMAAEHILKSGLKHFAYCGFDDKPWSVERSESFSAQISNAGYKTSIYKPPSNPLTLTWEKEQDFLVKWIKKLPTPVGLMCCNDDRSQQALQASKLAGMKVPDELAIIGADNDELICELSDPPLSSVSVNFERAGYEGAAVLDQLMDGKDDENRDIMIHASHVVPRLSTDITAIDDADVSKAVRFIRLHATDNICVSDVVEVVTLSRRVLEKRFRDQLGTTLLQEIRRVRTDKIAQMLIETNLSVSQIALSLSFNGNEHISRYFQREKNMSLLKYRKTYGVK
ncbi:MAG: DNA-binding transcriptional regulator [Candidatus Hinthialibacter antarcticus]|nr:DNA-binding transcriptional regulator [Candidatus Hinthialibacter antarcticus]